MQTQQEQNKQAVRRFNLEVIEQGNRESFQELMDPQFVNRSAPPEAPNGPESLFAFFNEVLRAGLPNLKVTIHDQLAEGDKVTTRKTIEGTHTGPLMGVPASHKVIRIEVIDIVRLRDGRYLEHWGINTFPSVLAQLKQS